MLFKSSTKRQFAFAFLFGLAIDVFAAYLIAVFFIPDFPAPVVALVLPLIVYAASATYALYNSLKRALWFVLVERKARVNLIVSQLYALKFPPPHNAYDSAADYLERTASAEDTSTEVRLFASQMIGTMSMLTFLHSILTNIVMEGAISQYRQETQRMQTER